MRAVKIICELSTLATVERGTETEHHSKPSRADLTPGFEGEDHRVRQYILL